MKVFRVIATEPPTPPHDSDQSWRTNVATAVVRSVSPSLYQAWSVPRKCSDVMCRLSRQDWQTHMDLTFCLSCTSGETSMTRNPVLDDLKEVKENKKVSDTTYPHPPGLVGVTLTVVATLIVPATYCNRMSGDGGPRRVDLVGVVVCEGEQLGVGLAVMLVGPPDGGRLARDLPGPNDFHQRATG